MAMRDKIEHAIQNQPCTVKDLKSKFGGDRGSDRKVMEAVDQLVHEAVICQRQGVFFTVRSGRADKALLCKVVKLGKNFAFVMLEDGTSDIFIPGRFTRGAMPGDMVLVEKFEHPRVEGSDEGEILAILEEKNDLVGTARRIEGRLKFVPDDCPAISMQLMRDCEGGAKDGDKVAVEILQRGNRQEDHRVGVAMRFGSSDEAKRCAKALLYAQDIRSRFPDKVRVRKRISLGGQFFLFCFTAFLFCDLLPKLFQRRITHMECPFPALRFFVQKLVQKMLPNIYKCFGDNVAVRIFILTRMNHAIVEAKNFSIRHSEENG